MMLVAWVVALRKFAYLKRIERGSEEFLRQWRQVSSDLTVLDHADEKNVRSMGGKVADDRLQSLVEQSPLYHIYQIGSEEIRHRIQSKSGFHGLSVRSITAIKASLDAGLTREVHRLNSGLVSLTIGIAGGPYVGLMGTVVGVMITFAVIAKTGQVEVNSIAPGIASALLATVFGLLVAIPALFLYSFLNSRIKNAVSDMQLFIDEFITKMAEFYPVTSGSEMTAPPFAFAAKGRTPEADDEMQEAVKR
jgi:biopolymer transport protein ExbB